MMAKAITKPEGQVTEQNPIINDPYEEPTRHWTFGEGEPRIVTDRRLSGYLPAIKKGGQLQITDQVIFMDRVNQLRDRVKAWREDEYPGATAVTRELFERWFDPEREMRPFFAQREAMETIVFFTEASADRRQGIDLPRVETYDRWAVKLATGAGKTLVMAMTIAWSGLNKIANRRDTRFADGFLVVCPNLTVKERLSGQEGLLPAHPSSAYRAFDLVPPNLSGQFGQLKVMVANWHALAERQDATRSVQRLGPEGDAAYCRRVLRDLGGKQRIMVLNDEAHHAWRPPSELAVTGEEKRDAEQATVWIRGLERISREREILRAIDFSATPIYPGAVREKAWQPFEWIISDFALVDAIESGLVKIPRIPTDDNAGRAVPKYRNLWEHIKKRLPQRGDDHDAEHHPLTDYLSEVDGPLKQLAGEWHETFEAWTNASRPVPPVMTVVCNDTKMAELLERHIAEFGEAGPWLENRDNEAYTIRIDSKLLEKAEIREDSESAADAAERLRRMVSTVGREGEPGEQVRCLISVSMLSEGWDARNVTQILGLRAFQSQLLCEQVVGRGLRRSDYSDLSRPEFVDIYGVPFQLLPFAKAGAGTPIEPPATTVVRALPNRAALRVEFPRVVQIVSDIGDTLEVDLDSIEPLRVSADFDPTTTYVEFETGAPGAGLGGEIQDRTRAYERFRLQRFVFRLAALVVAPYERPWLFPQAVKIVSRIIESKIAYDDGVDERELCNVRYLNLLRERIELAIRGGEEGSGLLPVLDQYQPVGSTDGVAFSTAKPCEPTQKSHLSHAVCDSELERGIARELERNPGVEAYAKNDRLFLEIPYRFLGKTHRYRPDFIVHLAAGDMLLIEGKGRPDEKDDAKATAARRWVDAVNAWGKLGHWRHAICTKRSEVDSTIDDAMQVTSSQ
jgi:type III restriction enzyme